jgi:type II secretory pathway predicted ATPase ExeA
MERPQVENRIAKAVKTYQKGSVLFVDDFLDLSHFGFSVKQLFINILVSSSTLFMIWMIFTKIFSIKINRIN